MRYYRSGHVHFYMALFLCIGFMVGALLGANIAEWLSNAVLKKAFGVFLIVVAASMIFEK
jgi:uncharacterized membrane protein YfcA